MSTTTATSVPTKSPATTTAPSASTVEATIDLNAMFSSGVKSGVSLIKNTADQIRKEEQKKSNVDSFTTIDSTYLNSYNSIFSNTISGIPENNPISDYYNFQRFRPNK
jgi:hypothetical protein